MKAPLHVCLLIIIILSKPVVAQRTNDAVDRFIKLPTKFFQKLQSGISKAESKLDRQTEKYLNNLLRQEKKLQKKLSKIDSTASAAIFSNSSETYGQLFVRLREKKEGNNPLQNSYVPFLDTLKTSLRFIEQISEVDLSKFPNGSTDAEEVLTKLNLLQGKFNQTEEIKRLIQERKLYLKQQLSKFGFVKEFRKFEQTVYYYQEQVKQYRELLNDPKALEATAIRLIQKIPAVSDFLSRHSELATLFSLPNGANVNAPINSQGLQTRNSVLQQMQQTLGAGVNPQQLIQQSNPDLRGQLNQLRDRITQIGGGGSSSDEIPDFKPNKIRTKPFLKRLEFGSNIQSVRGTRYFPATTDISLQLSYRISEKNVAGLAFAYKIGLGNGWRDIRLTHQGIGFRSYWDWKIKAGFWLSAGMEMNYRSEIKKIEVLKNFSAWQRSALAGISKKYRAGKKMQGNIQLLYDFLHQRQAPPGSPFVFRVGYTFSK